MFLLFVIFTKLGDNYVGISGSKTRNDYKVIQWIRYTTRMQYWLEEPKLRYASVGLVVIKLADWYTRCL